MSDNTDEGAKPADDAKQYDKDLYALQVKLVRLQQDIVEKGRRVLVIVEGRDAAGKGGAIKRFTENLSPRDHRVVALTKPSDVETGQWYFERYVSHLPNRGEIVFFDRSWYNRAVVEPVMGFCKPAQYKEFMSQVPTFEHLLVDDGIELVKLWFSISKKEQAKRFEARRTDPLKQWKLGPIDKVAQSKWSDYTKHARAMLARTDTEWAPWTVVQTDQKKVARLQSIRFVLDALGVKKVGAIDPTVVIPAELAPNSV